MDNNESKLIKDLRGLNRVIVLHRKKSLLCGCLRSMGMEEKQGTVLIINSLRNFKKQIGHGTAGEVEN